jgi:exopolyphosphatase/guanosine-5'-triphosphate,3'-diphosphate pyrophosphatase
MPEAALAAPVAAVDCGTNSTRLLIAGADRATLDRRMQITRLGQGVDRSGRLQPPAIERTLGVLQEYAEAMAAAGVVRALAVATSALRDATNAEAFLQPAAAVLGTALQVLSGGEEGRLSYRGATSELPVDGGPYVVVDVGGGSTELVAGSSSGSTEAVSLDVGCVRVTERFFSSDPPAPDELSAARTHVAGLTTAALARHPSFGHLRSPGCVSAVLVGLAGTVSALTVLALGLDRYDRAAVHHARLTRAKVEALLGELAVVDAATRRRRPGVERDRADVIVGGTVVLLTVMESLGFDELVVSESDILDGIVSELLDR